MKKGLIEPLGISHREPTAKWCVGCIQTCLNHHKALERPCPTTSAFEESLAAATASLPI